LPEEVSHVVLDSHGGEDDSELPGIGRFLTGCRTQRSLPYDLRRVLVMRHRARLTASVAMASEPWSQCGR
jgi:hypothetical protein